MYYYLPPESFKTKLQFFKFLGGKEWIIGFIGQLNGKAGKIWAREAYAYRRLLSFKASVTVSVVKQPSSDMTRFFVGHYLMSGANIQAWIKFRLQKRYIR